MARVRQFLLTLASGSALYSGMVPALGLGEISLHSALNQPLEADIQLLQLGDLNSDEIKVRLASADDFSRAGVDRFFFLNDLRFTPVLSGGRNVIRVQSNKPVREPYLNFIVEVVRPGGSLLREYTLLIDPPSSAAYTQLASPAPQYAQASAPVPASEPAPRAVAAAPLPPAEQGQRYRVQRGDSLWVIAQRLREAGSEVSQQVLMGEIYQLNPAAFIGGDRNRLRLQADLLLPDSAVPNWIAPSSQAAVAETAVEPDADQAVEPAVEPAVEKTAPATAPVDAAPASVEATAPAALDEALRDASNELTSQTLENQQLQGAISDLQTQLAQLQAQMAEKDRQLASITAELEQQRLSQSAPVAAPVLERVNSASPTPAWSLWLSAGGLCLVLIGGIWLLARRKVPPVQPKPVRQSAVPATSPALAKPRTLAETPPLPKPAVNPLASVPPQPLQPRPAANADPLEGANIYIAYGNFDQARSVLLKALEQTPQRLDLRLRLFEVLGQLGDANGFFAEQARLLELGASQLQVDQIRQRFSDLKRPSEAEDVLEPLLLMDEPATPVVAEQPAAVVQDDFQLNLDDLSLDADWDLVSPFKNDAPLRAKPASVAEVDPSFRSDLRELPDVQEMAADNDTFSPFANLTPANSDDDVLHEEFVDAFATQPIARPDRKQASNLQHLESNREHLAKLNMALAYIEQGDLGSACDMLNELIIEGDDQERARARELLAQIA